MIQEAGLTGKVILLVLLGVVAAGFIAFWVRALGAGRGAAAPDLRTGPPTPLQLAIGAVTNFFDQLGVGSFAPTTAIYRLLRVVPDRLIPGTLNVGHTPPTFAEAFISIAAIEVDMVTLWLLISASVLGAWLGAGVVSRWPARNIRLGMGGALLVAAGLFLGQVAGALPGGGTAVALGGVRLGVAIGGCFVIGAFMTVGVGAFGPIMVMVSLLGMNPKAAYPIMMGACAFLMPVASIRFVREKAYHPRAALGLAVGGVPFVLIAAWIVVSMDVKYVRWLVFGVVLYTAVTLLNAARRKETVT